MSISYFLPCDMVFINVFGLCFPILLVTVILVWICECIQLQPPPILSQRPDIEAFRWSMSAILHLLRQMHALDEIVHWPAGTKLQECWALTTYEMYILTLLLEDETRIAGVICTHSITPLLSPLGVRTDWRSECYTSCRRDYVRLPRPARAIHRPT